MGFSFDKELDDTSVAHGTGSVHSDINVNTGLSLCTEQKLCVGHYQIIFPHPETLVSSKYGHKLLLSKTYQKNISAVVVDEAHCILEWLVLFFVIFSCLFTF